MAGTAQGSVTIHSARRVPAGEISLGNLSEYAKDRLKAAVDYPKKRLIRRDFNLARLDLTVWFSSEELAGLCDRAYVRRKPGGADVARVEIYALDAQLPGWEAPRVWEQGALFSSYYFDQALEAQKLRGFYYHDTPSWQFFDQSSGIGVVSLLSEVAIPPWETSTPLRMFLHWAFASANMRLSHTATLGLGGRGALIVGAGGSGKSATALAGVRNGLQSVGDDYVLLDPSASLVARPIFTMMKLDPEGLRRLAIPPTALAGQPLNWHGKFEFDPADLCGCPLADRLEIDAILLPEIHRRKRTTIEATDSRRAALSFAPSATLQLHGDRTEGFRFFAWIVRRLPAFRLCLSEDPVEIAETIRRFLSRECSVAS